MKTCIICEQERPLTDFSTLPRRDHRMAERADLESITCTGCYWRQLVTHYAQLHIDEDGRCYVVYVPYELPRLEYVTEMRRWLPAWEKDAAVIKAYSVLGDMREQVRPFWEFAAALAGGEHGAGEAD